MGARKDHTPIPDAIAAAVLFASDRTCCVCRVKGKPVQIHHLDEDPSNNAARIWQSSASTAIEILRFGEASTASSTPLKWCCTATIGSCVSAAGVKASRQLSLRLRRLKSQLRGRQRPRKRQTRPGHPISLSSLRYRSGPEGGSSDGWPVGLRKDRGRHISGIYWVAGFSSFCEAGRNDRRPKL